jgi:hypothetical protein
MLKRNPHRCVYGLKALTTRIQKNYRRYILYHTNFITLFYMVRIDRSDLHGLVPSVRSFVRPTTFSGQFMQNERKPLTKNRTQAFNPVVSYFTDHLSMTLKSVPNHIGPSGILIKNFTIC